MSVIGEKINRKCSEVYLLAVAVTGRARGAEQLAFEAFFGTEVLPDRPRLVVKLGELREKMRDMKLTLVAMHEHMQDLEVMLNEADTQS